MRKISFLFFSLIMSESMKEFIHCTDPRSLHKAAHFEAFVYRHCSPCCVCHEFHSVTKGRYLTTHNSSQSIDGTTRHSYYYFNDDQRRPWQCGAYPSNSINPRQEVVFYCRSYRWSLSTPPPPMLNLFHRANPSFPTRTILATFLIHRHNNNKFHQQ